jgi:hypothetical protein
LQALKGKLRAWITAIIGATTEMKMTRASAPEGSSAKEYNGEIKKYQAVNTDKTATNTPGHRPAKKVVRIIAGKNVRNGRPGGNQASKL